MTVDEVIKYYGTAYAAAKALGLSQSVAYGWKKLNRIPIMAQVKIERNTKGILKASLLDMGDLIDGNE